MGVIWTPRGHLTVFADIFVCYDLGDNATAISGQRPEMLPNLQNAQHSPPWQSSQYPPPNVNSAKAEKAHSRRRARAGGQGGACDDGVSGELQWRVSAPGSGPDLTLHNKGHTPTYSSDACTVSTDLCEWGPLLSTTIINFLRQIWWNGKSQKS